MGRLRCHIRLKLHAPGYLFKSPSLPSGQDNPELKEKSRAPVALLGLTKIKANHGHSFCRLLLLPKTQSRD